jgi:hypothetical protein
MFILAWCCLKHKNFELKKPLYYYIFELFFKVRIVDDFLSGGGGVVEIADGRGELEI